MVQKDLELLQENQLRILDNIELPDSILELLVKPEESSVVTPEKEGEISDEVIEPTDEEDESEGMNLKDTDKKIKVTLSQILNCQRWFEWLIYVLLGGHAVNGVAEIHSEIVKKEVFNEFYKLWPEKFQNKTNGVTPRRWIRFCNPELSKIITKWTGTEDWVINTEKLVELRKFADNKELQSEWREAKRITNEKVVSFIKEKTGYLVGPDAMFDVQVVFVPDYNVSVAEVLIPGSELSQHIRYDTKKILVI